MPWSCYFKVASWSLRVVGCVTCGADLEHPQRQKYTPSAHQFIYTYIPTSTSTLISGPTWPRVIIFTYCAIIKRYSWEFRFLSFLSFHLFPKGSVLLYMIIYAWEPNHEHVWNRHLILLFCVIYILQFDRTLWAGWGWNEWCNCLGSKQGHTDVPHKPRGNRGILWSGIIFGILCFLWSDLRHVLRTGEKQRSLDVPSSPIYPLLCHSFTFLSL